MADESIIARSASRRENLDALLRNAVEDSSIATFVVTGGGEIIYANAALSNMLGYEAGGCVGLALDRIVHPDDRAGAVAHAAAILAGRPVPSPSELRYLRKDGGAVWVCASPALLPVGGKPLCLSVQVVDIDRLKRIEFLPLADDQRWRAALEDAGLGLWDYDHRTKSGYLSKAWNAMRGLGTGESDRVNLDAWLARIHPADRQRLDADLEEIGRGKADAWSLEYRERHGDGHWMWVMVRGRTVARNADGTPARVVGVDIDITERKNAEEALLFANTLLVTQLETSLDAILVVDATSRIISFNQRFVDMWAVPPALQEAREDPRTLAHVSGQVKDQASFLARVNHLYAHPEEEGRDEIETIDGRVIERHSGALKTPSAQYLGRVWYFRDVTDGRRADAHIRRSARYDGLTGIANRTMFLEAIGRATSEATRRGGSFAVLYLDLDQFKDVNDTLGHQVGDGLLKVVAARLCGNVRESDLVARFGGDEFAILAMDIGSEETVGKLADKIIRAMSSPFVVEGNDVRTAVSIGISMFDADAPDPETMLARADLALYRAKAEGPAVYRLFTPAMETEVRTRVRVGNELRSAIGTDQFFLMYQPQVEIETGRIVGTEALARWQHPVRGLIGPSAFISTAERTGLITGLGHWVLREACRQTKAWIDAGMANGVTAVNLSSVQFKRAYELEASIVAILAETGLPGSALELELTETVLMVATRDHSDVLLRLRERGVRLAIDDFGVGYSSLDYLRRFPVDRIKVAQEFVRTIETEPGSAAIVRATIGLARELGIALVAEGVETKAQLDLLRGWGCREAQGFYFAEPLTAEFLTPLLARKRLPVEQARALAAPAAGGGSAA